MKKPAENAPLLAEKEVTLPADIALMAGLYKNQRRASMTIRRLAGRVAAQSHSLPGVFAKALSAGLSTYFTLEYLLPLISGARVTCMASLDEIYIKDMKIIDYPTIVQNIADCLEREFGIYTVDFTYISESNGNLGSYHKIFLSTAPAIQDRLSKISSDSDMVLEGEGILDSSRSLFHEMGEILEYPACCIEKALQNRYDGTNLAFERKTAVDLREFPEENWYSLFGFEFFPCRPNCENAAAIGQRTERKLTAVTPALGDCYRKVMLPFHYQSVLNCFCSDKRPEYERVSSAIRLFLGLEE